ncbi:MAG: F0F1 ATP synthase subunit gamma, partial [Deltaproteobacteria bacterium]|nr:F0F1 ATP synthase subunit gamma [Deltaproteobacteria bacterium]
MISARILRRRIQTVENTAKICKAMEMIATAKMKRAQDQARAGRPYAEKISEVIEVISDLAIHPQVGEDAQPLLQNRETRKIAIIHFTTDRGLCGGLNANLNRVIGTFISEQIVPVTVITIGRKGRNFMLRAGQTIRAEFTGINDRPSLQDTLPISRVVIDDYSSGEVDLVYLTYPRFVSTMVQQPTMEVLLPIEPVDL